ncbi:MAG: hypothetical protein IJK27_02160 [Bacilli bacterium]|nr:hypothetical protein [Bacilli bacterium]
MTEIFILTDYKGRFGSKHNDTPYRSGFNLKLFEDAFSKLGIIAHYIPFSEVSFRDCWRNKIVLYTSSEDNDYLYKSYIEDVILNLELLGAIVIPQYKYLRCNNNKVFMEMQRYALLDNDSLNSLYFGTLEEVKSAILKERISFPCVFKTSEGACSDGVMKAESPTELIKCVKEKCASKNFKYDIRDLIRSKRHQGYIKESKYRKKFIVQPMVEGLENDWKLLIFGNKFFPLKRCVRKNDFRASGSHNNYSSGIESGIPENLMMYGYNIKNKMNVPMLSIDLAIKDNKPFMIEFQTVYFGSSTFNMTEYYYELVEGNFIEKKKDMTYEELFANCVGEYLIKLMIK